MAASATSDQSSDPQNNSMLQLPAYNTFFGIPPMQFQQMILEQMRRVPQIAAGGQVSLLNHHNMGEQPQHLTTVASRLPQLWPYRD